MALTLISSPERLVNGITSNVCAAKAQIPLKFNRVDYTGLSFVQWTAAGVSFQLAYDGYIESSKIGDLWYLTFDAFYVDGLYTLTGTNIGAGFATLQFDMGGYLGDTTGTGMSNNLKPNYVASLTITDIDTGELLLPAPLNYKPDQEGNLFVDLKDIFFGFEFFLDSLIFRVNYQELWTGGSGDVGDSPIIVGVAGFKQLQQAGGSTMWENAPNAQDVIPITGISQEGTTGTVFVFSLVTGYNVGDWVTVKTDKYNFTSQITSIGGTPTWFVANVKYRGTVTAGPGQTIGTTSRPGGLFLTESRSATKWLYYKRSIEFVIDSHLQTRTGSASLDFNLIGRDAAGASVYNVSTTYSAIGIHTELIPDLETAVNWEARLLVGGSLVVGSEIFKINQKTACAQPMLLEWTGRKGQAEQHLFSINQAINQVNKPGLVYDIPILDTLDNVSQSVGRLPLGAGQSITLTAEELTIEQFKSLRFMKESSALTLFLGSSGKSISVAIISDLSTPHETRADRHTFTCVIRLPESFEIEEIY